jgi:hypothetical protein
MPSPDLLSRLEVPAGERIYVAKCDLDNFYHRLRMPGWMQPYFALRPVQAADVGLDRPPGTLVYPCCTTLPMGWSHAAFLAQAAHVYTVDSRTSMTPADRITAISDLRVDRPRHGIYLDDTFWLGLECHLPELESLQSEYVRVLEAARLPTKPSKTVLPSCSGVECIGVEIHGVDLTAGVAPAKLAGLVHSTRALIARRKCTGLALSRIVGHWSWAFLCRRPCFSVFSAVYRFIEVAGNRMFTVWPSVSRELALAADLAPLLFSSIGAPWFGKTIATDASTDGQGVCATTADPVDLQHMAIQPLPEPGLPISDECRGVPTGLADSRWTDIVASPWRFHEHINVLELRALTTGLRWAVSSPACRGSRLLAWSDSLVTVYCVRKGRSSSYDLLRRLRRFAAILLAHDVYFYCNWIPTEVNPADGPSRRYKFDSTLGFPGEGPRKTFLLRAATSVSTRRRYTEALILFLTWLEDAGEDPASPRELDECLAEWCHELYILKGGNCRSHAENAYSACIHFLPFLKGQFHVTSLALRGWRRLKPSVSYPPMTLDVAAVVAAHMLFSGRRDLAIATLLAHHCYLRVGELTSIKIRDVADKQDSRLGSAFSGVAIRLPSTKTGQNQWVEVRSSAIQSLLRAEVDRARSKCLFNFGASTYRKHFKSTCASLGLSNNYVPHSLRHGGATHDHLSGVPLEEILRRGRWASTKSARHYIQSGRALLLTTAVPQPVSELGEALVPFLGSFFR